MKAVLAAALCAVALAAPAAAQELRFQFRDPSFGGNPFNSDHLLAIATAQRPERKADDSSTTGELTEAQLFARQIQSRLLSALSSSVVEAITGADPGASGEFTVGDQKISFERTLSEIKLTIFDNASGENTEIIVPVLSLNGAQGAASLSLPGARAGTDNASGGASTPEAALLAGLAGQ